jgi:cytochrome c5
VNPQVVFRAALLFMFVAAVGAAARVSSAQRQANKPKPSSAQAATTESAEGERLFQSQCSRCHVPPEDLSPREAKAVLRQMRVRANLTAEDERLILKYLAP